MFAVGLKKLVSSNVPAVMLIRSVSSRWTMIDDPQLGQNTRCSGMPDVHPEVVYVCGSPVIVTVPFGNPTTAINADPV
jgi:hypothetical protein